MKYLSTHRVQLGLAGIVATAFVFGPALAWSLGITPKAMANSGGRCNDGPFGVKQ